MVTVIAVLTAAQTHPCLTCLLLDSLRNSSVFASILLYNPNCLILELFEATETSLDIVLMTHHSERDEYFFFFGGPTPGLYPRCPASRCCLVQLFFVKGGNANCHF